MYPNIKKKDQCVRDDCVSLYINRHFEYKNDQKARWSYLLVLPYPYNGAMVVTKNHLTSNASNQ